MALALVGVECVDPPKPCTQCPNIAGTYHEIIPGEFIEPANCGHGFYSADDLQEVRQEGNLITLPVGDHSYVGTLYDDYHVDFPAIPRTDGSGSTWQQSLYLEFTQDEALWSYRGNFTVTLDNGCSYDADVSATQVK